MQSEYTDFFESLAEYSVKPTLFEPGEPRFWDDPHISKSMLEAHLDSEHESASRPVKVIDTEVNHILSSGLVKPGEKLLDMGCGPGLYASRLAAKGVKVTGIDISERSLNYASAQASKNNLDITFRRLNFLDLDYTAEFDAAMQIYGEMGVFSDDKRDAIIKKVYAALKPGGRFFFDLTTPLLKMPASPQNNWYFARSGFWRPIPHLTMEYRFDYPENNVFCNQYIVVDEKKMALYRVWNHNYTPDTITPALEKTGFRVTNFWNNLSGELYQAGGEWLAVAAEKV